MSKNTDKPKINTLPMAIEYLKNGGDLIDIPENFITKPVLANYIKYNITDNDFFKKIPPKFIVPKLISLHLKHRTDNKSFIDICLEITDDDNKFLLKIPSSSLNHDICLAFYKKNKQKTACLELIPDEFITQEMAMEFYEKRKNTLSCFKGVPEKFITTEMVMYFWEQHKNDLTVFKYLPKAFITEEMYNYVLHTTYSSTLLHNMTTDKRNDTLYINMFNSNPELICIIHSIPPNCLTKNLFNAIVKIITDPNNNINNSQLLKLFPDSFFTTEIIDALFTSCVDNINFLESIPEKFITKEMAEIFFYKNLKKGLIIDKLIAKFLTQKMCEDYFDVRINYKYFWLKEIPEQFITQEMSQRYFDKKIDNSNFEIVEIPYQFITQKMCDKYFEEEQKKGMYTFPKMPSKFITYDMCKKFFQVKKKKILYYFSNGWFSRDIPFKTWICVFEDECNQGNTLDDICTKYKIVDNRKEKIISLIKEENYDLYCKLLDIEPKKEVPEETVSEEEQKNYARVTFERMEFLKDLIFSLGKISQDGLTKIQKIKFAYNFFKQKPYRSIDVMYEWLIRYGDESYNDTINFFKYHLGMKYAKGTEDFEMLSKNEQTEKKYKNEWFDHYHLNEKFNGNMRITNNDVIIDKETAEKIVRRMKLLKIPRINCLVNEAIHNYLNGDYELIEFFNMLQGVDQTKTLK